MLIIVLNVVLSQCWCRCLFLWIRAYVIGSMLGFVTGIMIGAMSTPALLATTGGCSGGVVVVFSSSQSQSEALSQS